MSIKDRIVKALALRWARGKVGEDRKKGGGVMAMLDGNKRLLVVLAFIVSGFVALLTGHDVSQWVGIVLGVFGWNDPGMVKAAQDTATQVVPMLFAIWAAASSLWKMYLQHKAGATLVELNSPTGVVKAAVADGTLRTLDATPTALAIASAPKPEALSVVVVAQPVELAG